MSQATPATAPRQVAQRRRQLHRATEWPFARLLDRPTIRQALDDEPVSFRDRLFSPCVTLWVLARPGPSADALDRERAAAQGRGGPHGVPARHPGPSAGVSPTPLP